MKIFLRSPDSIIILLAHCFHDFIAHTSQSLPLPFNGIRLQASTRSQRRPVPILELCSLQFIRAGMGPTVGGKVPLSGGAMTTTLAAGILAPSGQNTSDSVVSGSRRIIDGKPNRQVLHQHCQVYRQRSDLAPSLFKDTRLPLGDPSVSLSLPGNVP